MYAGLRALHFRAEPYGKSRRRKCAALPSLIAVKTVSTVIGPFGIYLFACPIKETAFSLVKTIVGGDRRSDRDGHRLGRCGLVACAARI